MSVEHSKGIKEIRINDRESIIIESKWQEVYEWDEVSYKSGEDVIFIGSYYTYDMHLSRGWLKYNNETIAIAKEYIPTYCVDGIQVDVIFDIKSRLFVEGNKEDLLEYYTQQFGSEKQVKDNDNVQGKLLIKKNNNK